MDLYELVERERCKDAYEMKKMFGDYYRNAEDDVYSELAEIEKNTYQSEGKVSRLPSALGFLGLLGEFIIGETLPGKKKEED